MVEPSYYPLSLEGTTSPSPEQPFEEDPDSHHLADIVEAKGSPTGSRFIPFLSPLRPPLFRKGQSAGRPPLWRSIRTPLKMALLPLVAIGYLAFCYTVHGKVIPVNTYGLYAVTPQHLATIKGGITSISIIVISIALYPIYDVVCNLKSEEFFRVLASHSHGVPLETINHISTPSFGYIDMMIAMRRHTCSKYYILGVVASLLIWVVATLAPGTLTVDSVLADGELMAFAIGAVPPQSVLNGTFPAQPAYNATPNAVAAAYIVWAEMELDVQYNFGIENTSEPDYVAYIAPVPLHLSTTTSARWLTDVIGINPACSWASTNLTAPVQIPVNSTSAFNATVYLPDFNLNVQVTSLDTSLATNGSTPFATVKDPTCAVTNHTTHTFASGGSTVFLLGQCQSGCLPGTPVDLTLDLTGLNTTFTISLTDQTWSMAILACIPNITIETREVRNNGDGVFSVQPLPAGGQLTRQGNLNLIQTTALFSIATMSLSQNAGPLSETQIQYTPLGSQVQGDVLFGKTQFESLPGNDVPYGTMATIVPAPIENVTQGYTQILRSSAKSYLAGYLGTAYVPGRISDSKIVFAASIPNLAVSTAVFALLAVLIVIAHFRPGKGTEFTLVNVAAAVHGSELPARFARIKADQPGSVYEHTDVEAEGDTTTDETEGTLGNSKVRRVGGDSPGDWQDITEMLGERRIFMQRRADDSPVLYIS